MPETEQSYRIIYVLAQIHLAVLDEEGHQVDTLVVPTTPLYYPHGERLEAAIAQAEEQAAALYASAGGSAGVSGQDGGTSSASGTQSRLPPAQEKESAEQEAPHKTHSTRSRTSIHPEGG